MRYAKNGIIVFFIFLLLFLSNIGYSSKEEFSSLPLISSLSLNNQEEALAFYYWMRGDDAKSLNLFKNIVLNESISEEERFVAWDIIEKIDQRIGNQKDIFDLGNKLLTSLDPSSFLFSQISYTLYYTHIKKGHFDVGDKFVKKLGFINKWSFIGPFDNTGMSGIYKELAPEKEIDFSKIYNGKEGIQVKWFTPLIFPRYGYVDLESIFYPSHSTLAYALTYVYIPYDGEFLIGIGADDVISLWINDKFVFTEDKPKRLAFDQYRIDCRLKKGWNKILLKIGQDKGEWGFYFRIINKNGNPIEGLEVSTDNLKEYNRDILITKREEVPNLSNDNWENFVKGYILFSKYSLDDAKKFFKKIYDDIHSPLSAYFLGLAYLQDNNINKAYQYFQHASDDYTYFIYPIIEIGKMKINKGLYDEAIEIFKKLSVKFPNNYMIHTFLGWIYKRRGWEKEARQELERVIDIYPDYTFPHYLLASMYDENMWTEDAIEEYSKILSLTTTHGPAFSSLLSLYMQIRDKERAVSLVKKRLEIYPTDINLYLKLVSIYRAFKDEEKAIETLRKALSVTIYHPLIYKELGMMYHYEGNETKAFDCFVKALDLDPALLALKDYLKFLRNQGKAQEVDAWSIIKKSPTHEKYPEADALILLDKTKKIIYPDGTSTTYYHKIIKIFTIDGRERYGEFFINYILGGQRIKIIRARTFKPNGEVVEATSIKDIKPMEGYRLYSDLAQKIISLPALSLGSSIEVYYSVDDLGREIMGKNFQDTFYFQSYDPILHSVYILKVPKGKKFRYKVVGIDIKPEVKEEKGDVIYKWEARDLPQILPEPSMPSYSEIATYLFISSFKSWKEISDWVYEVSEPQIKAGNELKKKVKELVKNTDSRMDKIKRIYEYVITNIRYVGLEFGISGFMPHKADEVFRYKYGDCKDKATLMKSMLSLVGIKSYFTLIRTRDLGHLDKDIPGLKFNHAILTVKDDKGNFIFLDGTAEDTPFGELPGMDQGTEVMIVTKDGPIFKKIPIFSYTTNEKNRKMDIIINKDGHLEAEVRMLLKGFFGAYYRAVLKSMGKIKRKEIIQRSLSALCPGAKLEKFKFSDLRNLDVPVIQEYKFHSDLYLKKTPFGYRFYPSILERFVSGEEVAKSERRYPIVKYLPYIIKDTIRYKLEKGLIWGQIPENVSIDTPFGTYSLTFKLENGILVFSREFTLKKVWIDTSEYKAYKEFIETVIESDKKEINIIFED